MKRLDAGGKNERMLLMMAGAFATGSGGNIDGVERVRPQAGAQRIDRHRAVHGEQPADTVQRETKAKLNRGQLEGDDHQEREALGAVRHDRIEHADDLDLDEFGERGIEHSGVLALFGIERNVSSASNHAGVDLEAEPVRRL